MILASLVCFAFVCWLASNVDNTTRAVFACAATCAAQDTENAEWAEMVREEVEAAEWSVRISEAKRAEFARDAATLRSTDMDRMRIRLRAMRPAVTPVWC